MSRFWEGQSLEEVVREYLLSTIDNVEGVPNPTPGSIADILCKDITIKNSAEYFVADYLTEVMSAVRQMPLGERFSLSDYDYMVNVTMRQTAKNLLERCPVMQNIRNSRCKKADILQLREELSSLILSKNYTKADSIRLQSVNAYTYHILEHMFDSGDIKQAIVPIVKLNEQLPLYEMSYEFQNDFLKSNFHEIMNLLEDFQKKGYQIDYTNSAALIRSAVFQCRQEIFNNNPYLQELLIDKGIEYVKLTPEFLDSFRKSLREQEKNISLNKFETMEDCFSNPMHKETRSQVEHNGKILDIRKKSSQVELIS